MKKIVCMACCLLLFVALGINYENIKAQESVITLSINPSFEIKVDNNSKVTSVKALNADAQKVLETFDDFYLGQKPEIVLSSLIKESSELGYFEKDGQGFEKDIIISSKKGNFDVSNLDESISQTVKELKLNSETITVNKEDFSTKNTKDNSGSYISEEKAKEIVAKRVGASLEDIEFTEKEFELEKDRHIYDFEINYNGEKYEIDIDASTGAIIDMVEDENDVIEDDKDIEDDVNDHEDDEDDLEENNDDGDEIDDDDFAQDTDNEDEGDDDMSDDTDDDVDTVDSDDDDDTDDND